MNELISGAAVLAGTMAVGTGLFLARVLTRYRGPGKSLGEEETKFAGVSLSRYRVMARLSSSEDLQFLRSLPGFREEMAARLGREQRRIYRLYLRDLAADFRRLHASARALVSHAPAENAELVGMLAGCQFRFWRNLAIIEARLALGAIGIQGADAGALIGNVDELRAALSRASALPASA
jgi:hypothetical protein